MTAITRRLWLAGAAASAGACATTGSEPLPDAIVGVGQYRSIQSALDAAPENAGRPWRILVRDGVWKEKLTVSKPWIHLVGETRSRSIIDFDAAAGLKSPDGTPWGTFRSATLTVSGADVALRNLTIRNSFDYVGARANPADNAAGDGLQAVALAIMRNADRVAVEDVALTSYQDTLLANAGRSLFRNCTIAGAVDYIFGAGTVFFDRCITITRTRPGVSDQRQGYITAPSTLAANPYGLVFSDCRMEREPGLRVGAIALGRPWRPGVRFDDGTYGNPDVTGQAVFLRCWMDDHIDPVGWDHMAYAAKGGGRAWFEPEEARFFEYASTGPGASSSNPKRRILTDTQAQDFTRERVLGDWKP